MPDGVTAVRGAERLGLSPAFLRRLERLAFVSPKAMVGQAAAQRLSPRPGASVEFSDFRTYVPGDDFRRVDWNAFARLDKLLLKLYLGEEDMSVHLWLDSSASMDFGEPSKAGTAKRLAGALAYVGLSAYDRVGAAGFAETITAAFRPRQGRQNAERLWTFLADLPSGGATMFDSVRTASRPLRPGLSIIVSDFLTEDDPGPALTALRTARQQTVLLQVLSIQELSPEIKGDLALKDIESGAKVEVTVTPALLDDYQRALAAHTARLAAIAKAHRALFHQVSTGTSLESLMFKDFRRIGLLR